MNYLSKCNIAMSVLPIYQGGSNPNMTKPHHMQTDMTVNVCASTDNACAALGGFCVVFESNWKFYQHVAVAVGRADIWYGVNCETSCFSYHWKNFRNTALELTRV